MTKATLKIQTTDSQHQRVKNFDRRSQIRQLRCLYGAVCITNRNPDVHGRYPVATRHWQKRGIGDHSDDCLELKLRPPFKRRLLHASN